MTCWKHTVVAALLSFGLACGHDASIVKTDGTFVDGIILSSEPDTLRLQLENGTEQSLPRKAIAYVDYPGTGLLLTGAALILAGFATGMDTNTHREFFLASLPFGIPGLGIGAWGAINNLRSRSAARAFQARTNELENINQPITGPVPYHPAPRFDDPLPHRPVRRLGDPPAPATNMMPDPPKPVPP